VSVIAGWFAESVEWLLSKESRDHRSWSADYHDCHSEQSADRVIGVGWDWHCRDACLDTHISPFSQYTWAATVRAPPGSSIRPRLPTKSSWAERRFSPVIHRSALLLHARRLTIDAGKRGALAIHRQAGRRYSIEDGDGATRLAL